MTPARESGHVAGTRLAERMMIDRVATAMAESFPSGARAANETAAMRRRFFFFFVSLSIAPPPGILLAIISDGSTACDKKKTTNNEAKTTENSSVLRRSFSKSSADAVSFIGGTDLHPTGGDEECARWPVRSRRISRHRPVDPLSQQPGPPWPGPVAHLVGSWGTRWRQWFPVSRISKNEHYDPSGLDLIAGDLT